tara:strand:- start:1589 stop:2002 length:414 start_codon:yes stop_codon:yes gene_type:complete
MTTPVNPYQWEKSEIKGNQYNDDFNEFWYVFPRKRGKRYAFNCWLKATRFTSGEIIMDALRNQVASGMLTNGQFTPFPSTWLNQERWEDSLEDDDTRTGISESTESAVRLVNKLQQEIEGPGRSIGSANVSLPEQKD